MISQDQVARQANERAREDGPAPVRVVGDLREKSFSWYNEDSSLEWTPSEGLRNPVAAACLPPSAVSAVPVVEDMVASAEMSKLQREERKLSNIIEFEKCAGSGQSSGQLQQVPLGLKEEAVAEVIRAQQALILSEQGLPTNYMTPVEEERLSQSWLGSSGTSTPVGHESSPGLQNQILLPFPTVPVAVPAAADGEVSSPEAAALVTQPKVQSAPSTDSEHINMIEQAQLQAEARFAGEMQSDMAQNTAARRRRRRGEKTTGPEAASGDLLSLDASRCEQLTELLESGSEARSEAVSAIRGSVLGLSFQNSGCRLVQHALQIVDVQTGVELVEELQGRVCEALQSPHANFVIQKVIEVLPCAQSTFVSKELLGTGIATARHRYGCRILCRLMEHCAAEPGTKTLIDEVLEDSAGLCRHSFGHHVMQCVLEHGSVKQQELIVKSMMDDLPRNVRNRNASYVLERVLMHCDAEIQRVLLAKFLDVGPEMWSLLTRSYLGSHVARSLMQFPRDILPQAMGDIRLATGKLYNTRHGKQLLKELGMMSSTVGTAY